MDVERESPSDTDQKPSDADRSEPTDRDSSGFGKAMAQAADRRDAKAAARDERARSRDDRADQMDSVVENLPGPWAKPVADERMLAASDRARSAADRRLSADDRRKATDERTRMATEITRLESRVRATDLDDLTGAHRREAGGRLLAHEIDRARRADGRFVLAYVDVDGLKTINDRDGHAAGDQVLQTVVAKMRSILRSYDPIVRHGGDEFLCGMGAVSVADAGQRFADIDAALARESIGISVGLAALEAGETRDQLIQRADRALLEAKRRRGVADRG
jgi:diguanylate cyclase (GGDEF)-like protein